VALGFAHAAPISYVYDDLGRLIAVIDEASEMAIYQYDAVGNLLSISRQPSSTVKVLDFRPKSGPVGTTAGRAS
jgi:YD repeat-containing protein